MEQLQKELTEAEAKEQQIKDELAKIETEKVEVLRRLAEEAAVEAKVEMPLQPKLLLQGLSSLAGQMQQAHCQVSGLSPDQIKAVSDMLSGMLQGQLLVPPAAAAGASGAAQDPKRQQQQQQEQPQPL